MARTAKSFAIEVEGLGKAYRIYGQPDEAHRRGG